MKKSRILVPAISVGLFVNAREAIGGTIDFGVVAESLGIAGTLDGQVGAATIGNYTLGVLTFVGSHLGDVINGATVTALLSQLLGAEGATLAFDFSGNGGASGNFTFTGSGLTLNNNSLTLNTNPMTGTLADCTGTLPKCTPGTEAQLDPYDPAGLLQDLEAANILTVTASPSLSDGALAETDAIETIALGSFNGNTYQGEEILTTDSVSAAPSPEPASWSLAALGSALFAWRRRRRG